MGAAESKPEGYSWKAYVNRFSAQFGSPAFAMSLSNEGKYNSSGPPSVSLSVIDSLQSSPETDASRAKLIEHHIQSRVSEELKKLQKKESDALKLAQDKIAEAASASTEDGGPTRHTLGREIDDLRKKLEERKNVRDLPESVEKARSNVIRCLRENDRRPLNCFEEVEAFKAEVKKLEKEWVNKVTA
ncbi:MICOS complex subunit mic19-like protein [Cladobotryum mycophilum]|uniref:MICOS complex subunit mic19-like protein n=1 Tax=Cladobotryum mycophilum TaxID=491253 RepID=A0ABR0SGB6_9HYPO